MSVTFLWYIYICAFLTIGYYFKGKGQTKHWNCKSHQNVSVKYISDLMGFSGFYAFPFCSDRSMQEVLLNLMISSSTTILHLQISAITLLGWEKLSSQKQHWTTWSLKDMFQCCNSSSAFSLLCNDAAILLFTPYKKQPICPEGQLNVVATG